MKSPKRVWIVETYVGEDENSYHYLPVLKNNILCDKRGMTLKSALAINPYARYHKKMVAGIGVRVSIMDREKALYRFDTDSLTWKPPFTI